MNSATLVQCPVCKTPNLVRVIGSGAGMIFKGSGFYQTDYKNTHSATDSKPKKTATEKKETPPPPPKKAD